MHLQRLFDSIAIISKSFNKNRDDDNWHFNVCSAYRFITANCNEITRYYISCIPRAMRSRQTVIVMTLCDIAEK